MGLFDQLGSSLKTTLLGAAGSAAPELLDKALAQTNFGSLQRLVEELRQNGLERQVQSWLGNGSNLPVTPDQLRTALDNDQLRELAQKFGLPLDKVLDLLSQHLPQAVDEASPNGQLQQRAAT